MKINDPIFWKDKKVFITGGTGFIGKHLVNKLKSLGAEVRVFTHVAPSSEKCFWGDISEWESIIELQSYLEDYCPDVIFHLAAQPLVNYAEALLLKTLNVNVTGSYLFFYACSKVKSIQSIVHISTDKVYGNLPIITEKDIPNGVEHPYNASKLASDVLAQMFANTFDLPLVVIRNGNVYGAGDQHWERIIPGTIGKVLNGFSPVIRGNGESLRDYIHVDEIVVGFINAAEYGWGKPGSKTLRLGSSISTSVKDVVDLILQKTKRIDLIPVYEKVLKGEIPNQHILDKVSQKEIGWYPKIDLDQGLEMTIPYYRELK
jgi:CDP-glucose 4,6-dehydratase